MRRIAIAAVGLGVLAAAAGADSGVLLPGAGTDAEQLRLRAMRARVEVDGMLVRTRVTQVFENVGDRAAEAKYVFRLPLGAGLSDFAIWEDGVRIPGVVLERRRAAKIYEELTAQKVDPGVVESAGGGGEDAGLFAARVFPIPGRGTKRIEIELSQELEVSARQARYVLPLAPDKYRRQVAGEVDFEVRVLPGWALAEVAAESPRWGGFTPRAEGGFELAFEGQQQPLDQDLAFRIRVADGPHPVEVLAQRDPRERHHFEPFDGGTRTRKTGFVSLRYLVPEGAGNAAPPRPTRWLFLADFSLSVRWEKLAALAAAVRDLAGALAEDQLFDLVAFSHRAPEVVLAARPGGPGAGERAMAALAKRPLGGGTDLAAAAAYAGEWLRRQPPDAVAVLITDGHATRGATDADAVLAAFGSREGRGRLLTLGVGRGARRELLESLATKGAGYYVGLDELADPAFALARFRDQVTRAPVREARVELPQDSSMSAFYPERAPPTFVGSTLRFVGRYAAPDDTAAATLRFERGGEAETEAWRFRLPEHSLEHPGVPRLWAQERVEHLLARIDREGESEALIDEIVWLAKRHKLATPYTSFLAAPRALLRPRFIKPGDPVLRVKARPGVTQVTALMPWGEVLPLRTLPDEGVFEGRFLAPEWVPEGRHAVRLVLAGEGQATQVLDEHFRLDGTAPTVTMPGELPAVHPGDRLALAVYADADTRSITARLPGGAPVPLRYTSDGHVSRGVLAIPALAPGRYPLRIEAEDFAHNRSSRTWTLEVQG